MAQTLDELNAGLWEYARDQLIAELRDRIRFLRRFRTTLHQVRASRGDRRVNAARIVEAKLWLARLERA